MTPATISIEVDADTGRLFSEASSEERMRLQLLLGLRLLELTSGRTRPLKEVKDDIGTQAQARGRTPEIPKTLLHGE